MDLKLITIDFWNTLYTTSNNINSNNARVKTLYLTFRDMGLSDDDFDFDAIISSSWRYYNDVWVNEVRTPDAREILEWVWNVNRIPVCVPALDYLVDFFEKMVLLFPPELETGALDSIRTLSDKFLLGIVSDTGFSPGWAMSEMMREQDVLRYFSFFSYSDETGVAKPHPKAFQVLLDKLNISPQEALHIGDIEATDILGASSIGMHSIRYDGGMSNQQSSTMSASQADIILHNWTDITEYILSNYSS